MAEEISNYDAADYLRTPEDCALYLQAVMEDGGNENPAMLAHALGTVARARGISQLSRETGISREGLYKALDADGNPSLATVMKVLGALGLRLQVMPVGAG